MRIYRCEYWDRDLGSMVSWHSSRRDAERALAELRRDSGPEQGPAGVEEIDFPRTRKAIIDWLNQNCDSQNG